MEKKIVKVAWCCARHEMTAEQASRLAELCGVTVDKMEIAHLPILWKASPLSHDDIRDNRITWSNIMNSYDIIAGVFPPAAMESLESLRASDAEFAYGKCVFTPIFTPISSVIRVTLGGKTIKRLVFHRWTEV